eukprot:PhM_4_TR9779/c0_g1_i1/m.40127
MTITRTFLVLVCLSVAFVSSASVDFPSYVAPNPPPPGAILAGDTRSNWVPPGAQQYVCVPIDDTGAALPFFGRLDNPGSDQPDAGTCFYFNATDPLAPHRMASVSKSSLVATSTSKNVYWTAVTAGYAQITSMVSHPIANTSTVVVARTNAATNSIGNNVPGYATVSSKAVLGRLVAADYGFFVADQYEVLSTEPLSTASLPKFTNVANSVRVIHAVATPDALDFVLTAKSSGANCSFSGLVYGMITPWCVLDAFNGVVLSVFKNVNGARADTPSVTTTLSNVTNGAESLTVSFTGVVGYLPTPAATNQSVRLVNLVNNSAPIGVSCRGSTTDSIVPESVEYGHGSAYVAGDCDGGFSVTSNGGRVVGNVTTLAAPGVASTIFVVGNVNQSVANPTRLGLVVDANLLVAQP